MDMQDGATEERMGFYRRISANHLTPLWEVLGSLVPKRRRHRWCRRCGATPRYADT